jgi:hypothetical protein
MDYVEPVEALLPGVQGKVLGVLARNEAELSVRAVARLARVSPSRRRSCWAIASTLELSSGETCPQVVKSSVSPFQGGSTGSNRMSPLAWWGFGVGPP